MEVGHMTRSRILQLCSWHFVVGSQNEADRGNVISIHTQETIIFAYMEVVSVRLFSKAKDKPHSWMWHGKTGKSRREAVLYHGVRCVQIALQHCHLRRGNV